MKRIGSQIAGKIDKEYRIKKKYEKKKEINKQRMENRNYDNASFFK